MRTFVVTFFCFLVLALVSLAASADRESRTGHQEATAASRL